MKAFKTSFLFFCILILWSSMVFGQQAADSLGHYRELILNPEQSDDLISGYTFFSNHKDLSFKQQDTLAAVYDLQMLVIAQIEFGVYYEAEVSLAEGLKLLDLRNNPLNAVDSDYRWRLYNELGILYRKLRNDDKALEAFNNALAVKNAKIDTLSIFKNIGNIFKDKGLYQLAEKEFNKVYQALLKGTNLKKTANALNSLGAVQAKLDNPEGLEKMQEALAITISENDRSGTFSSYHHLAQYYKDRNDIEAAKEYALLGYEVANGYSPSYKLEALSNLLELSNDTYVREYIRMNDSLSRAKSAQENKFAIAKYNLEKEQRKTLESQIESERLAGQKISLLFILTFILLTSVFLYFILRLRHKRSKVVQLYNTETRISRKVHDEVANDVYHSMVMLENDSHTKGEIIDSLESIYNKTRDISKETAAIEVHEDYDQLLHDLLLSYKNNEVTVIAKNISKIDWTKLSGHKKTVLYRVLQELMTNMKKYSYATLVGVVFSMNKSKLIVDYTDNGIGCELNKKGGLSNTENRIKLISGRITFDTAPKKGFKAQITI